MASVEASVGSPGKTKLGIVRQFNHLIFRLKLDHWRQRTKGLFFEHERIFGDVGQDCRLVECSLASISSNGRLCTLFQGVLDVFFDLVSCFDID